MNEVGERILAWLQTVDRERACRDADPTFARRVWLVKRWQQLRFEHCYADLLESPRYRQAALFFLQDLYGPADFRRRDQQFARIVPGLVRLFPHEVVETVGELAELHAISERLDSAMARCPWGPALTRAGYVQAWNQVGEPVARQRQIALVMSIGAALDRLTRRVLVVKALRVMRAPARAAGLEALQDFLESGMDSFRGMRGAQEFLATVEQRERALMQALFDSADETGRTAAGLDGFKLPAVVDEPAEAA